MTALRGGYELAAAPSTAPPFSDRHGRALTVFEGTPDAAVAGGFYVRFLKRVVDLVAASVLVLVTLPLLLCTVVAAGWSCGASSIFAQQRVGRGGRLFTMYKLRTMCDDPESERALLRPNGDGRIVHKVVDEPRITRAGRFLPKWSLDELPQLWNVVRGDMSLVGPRPELPRTVAHYQSWQHRRHDVRPGMTGLWQVSARSQGLLHECVDIDVEYVNRLSLANDMKILALTPLAALGRRTGI